MTDLDIHQCAVCYDRGTVYLENSGNGAKKVAHSARIGPDRNAVFTSICSRELMDDESAR